MKKLASLATIAAFLAMAQPAFAWELRVCAQPANPPVSSEDGTGFENRIAEVLADEMGADLTFEWLVLNRNTVAYDMKAGDCDVAMGVADGAGGLISTIAYYQTPYVWVFPADGPQLTGALDDPQLDGLRLATYPNSLTDNAIRSYGWGDQLVHVEPGARNLVYDYTEPTLEALLAGEVDAALLEGPRAGYFVQQHPELAMAPVSPLIIEPIVQLYRISTMAVRAGDESLRDQLNIALANRWDEVQAILADYGVPTLEMFPPAPPQQRAADALVGVLLPTPATPALETDAASAAAREGARFADTVSGNSDHLDIRMITASTPSVESAVRAAERLIELDGVDVLVGGIGAGQADAIAEVANELGVPFISIDPFAGEPGAYAFSVGIGLPTLLDVVIGQAGTRDWFAVTGPDGIEPVSEAVLASGGNLVGNSVIEGATFVYYDLLAEIAGSGADAVLLNLPNTEQEQFIAQAAIILGDTVEIHAVTDIVGQSRDFLLRWRTVSTGLAPVPRVSLWEPSQRANIEVSMNYSGRTGRVFDPAAWAGYAAMSIAHQVIDSGADDLTAVLTDGTEFIVGKQNPVWFDADTHELQQDLYLISINPDVEWNIALANQMGLADTFEVIPTAE